MVPWHRRLETRVAIAVGLVIGICLAAVLFASAHIVQTNALSRATDDLQGARSAFDRLVDTRGDFAAEQLRLVTELPVFRAYMTPAMMADEATIHAMADGYRERDIFPDNLLPDTPVLRYVSADVFLRNGSLRLVFVEVQGGPSSERDPNFS